VAAGLETIDATLKEVKDVAENVGGVITMKACRSKAQRFRAGPLWNRVGKNP
jgi:hypothetical protein